MGKSDDYKEGWDDATLDAGTWTVEQLRDYLLQVRALDTDYDRGHRAAIEKLLAKSGEPSGLMYVRFVGDRVMWTVVDTGAFYNGYRDECSPEELALCEAGGGYLPLQFSVVSVAL